MRKHQVTITLCNPHRNYTLTAYADCDSSPYEALAAATHELLTALQAGGTRLPERGCKESHAGRLGDHNLDWLKDSASEE